MKATILLVRVAVPVPIGRTRPAHVVVQGWDKKETTTPQVLAVVQAQIGKTLPVLAEDLEWDSRVKATILPALEVVPAWDERVAGLLVRARGLGWVQEVAARVWEVLVAGK